jgi:DNA mismatch repair protein MutL
VSEEPFLAGREPGGEADFAAELPGLGEKKPEGFFSGLKQVGILWESFILLEDENRCYVLDQHAAHERVLFEKLKQQASNTAQNLLLPLPVDCTPAEQARAEEFRAELEELGFSFEVLGPRSLLLHRLPLTAEGIAGDRVFLETLADLAAGGSGESGSGLDGVKARLACRLAVKAGRQLTREEIARLLAELDRTPNAQTCPHGRPFFFSWSRAEISKRFQR